MKRKPTKELSIPELNLPALHPDRLGGKTPTQVLFKRAQARDSQQALQILTEASALAPTDLKARAIIINSMLMPYEVALRKEQISYLETRVAA